MADIILSSCCYTQIVYSATSWLGSITYLSSFEITGDTNIMDGCYTIVSGVTAFGPFSFDGTATSIMGCLEPPCSGYCCDELVCVDIPLSTYTGYNGTYTIVGSYNAKPYWTGGTSVGYIFYDSNKWCIGDGLGGTVFFFGSFPTNSVCPDFSSTIYTEGSCVPAPTPTPDPCGLLDFDVLLECEIPTPPPVPTPTPPPTPTPTPTPTPDPCTAFTASISATEIIPIPTPTPTPTPTPPPTPLGPPSANTVTFILDSGYFVCSSVKELVDCETNDKYYVNDPLIYSGSGVTTGTTFLAQLNDFNSDQIQCVTYTNTLSNTSPNRIIKQIFELYSGGCSQCVVPIVDPCSAFTASISATEITPTPITYPSGTSFVFTSCTNNSMIIQTAYPPTNFTDLCVSQTPSGECYTYIGNFVNYIPPTGYLVSHQDVFTATTTATTYTTCLECLLKPEVTLSYIQWRGKSEYSLSCPVCELTNYGVPYSWYTSSADTTIQTGVYVYEDTNLTIPLYVDYIEYDTKIYEVDNTGKITEFCNVNGNCT